jgi:hypothetical protein
MRTKRIHGLAAEEATSCPGLSLPATQQHKQAPDLLLRSHRATPDPDDNYVGLSKRAFIAASDCFYKVLNISFIYFKTHYLAISI